MKTYSFISIQGNVGKSSIVYNFSRYLASKDYKVLIIDMDHQCSISRVFKCDEKINTVKGIFTHEKVKIKNVSENIDLIEGSYDLNDVENWMINQPNKDTLLLRWLSTNMNKNLKLSSKYDVILIDTITGFESSTRNSIAASDKVINVDIPISDSKMFRDITLKQFKECVVEISDSISTKPYVKPKYYVVGNVVNLVFENSRLYIEELKESDDYLTYFIEKNSFSIEKYQNNSNTKEDSDLFKPYRDSFEKILSAK